MGKTTTRRIIRLAAALCGLLAAGAAHAASDDEAPSVYLDVKAGYSIYKSEMVQSNDTGVTIDYGFGVWAGQSHSVGMSLNREQSTFAFDLNGSAIGLSWQDIHGSVRFGMFKLGIVVSSSSTWIVSAPLDADGDGVLDPAGDAEDYLNITTTGLGGNFGLNIPVNKRSELIADVNYITTQAVQEKSLEDASGTLTEKESVALGPRLDLDLGASLSFARWFDLLGGFKYRTYKMIVDGTTYTEQLNTTYIGVLFSSSF